MSIPQSDPKAGYRAHQAQIESAIARVLESGWFILGQETTAFEREFAEFLGASAAVGVASGTDALVLALRASGVQPGDLVFTVSHTAVATVAAIELAEAVPVLVDVDLATMTISPESLESAIQEAAARASSSGAGQPKAIIAVHLYGHPADLPALLQLAQRYGLILIEDCAQSHGATLQGRQTGTWGQAAAFSFYPTKNLGALGDGGAVVTNDPAIADRVRLLREYGWRRRYVSDCAGMNSRLDELQSAILRAKLEHLEAENEARRRIAQEYDRLLRLTSLRLPMEGPETRHVYHQYVVRTERRDDLQTHLKAQKIGSLVHYPVPVHLQPAYRERIRLAPGGLPNTEAAARTVLSLPMFPQLDLSAVGRVGQEVVSWSVGQAPPS